MKKTAVIKITLQSDLCAGSGYSFAGIIDSDICYDDCGIPYIPARRIKGCMRECAETILYSIINEEQIEELFGKAGNDSIQGISIGNAYIADYEKVYKEAKAAISHKVVNEQEILEQFTHIQAQTAMKDGIAEEKTLRYTRVVDRISPFDEEAISFYAQISFDDTAEDVAENNIRLILQATRNIGLKRTRGMGSVTCSLINVKNTDEFELENTANNVESGERWKKISYILRNEEPLMMSGNSDDHSEKYISGQAILGALAGRYPKQKKSSDDSDFRSIFLGGEVYFSNAYPYVDQKICYPAPEYINQLKKTKCCVNTYFTYDKEKIKDEELQKLYNPDGGNIPKKLKGKFVCAETNQPILVHDVDMEVRYHHSHRASSRTVEGLLYPMVSVCKGQLFSGCIYTKEERVSDILKLLKAGPLALGKSRTSQYGKCVLVEEPILEDVAETQKIEKGQWILVELLSDTLLVNDTCEYTVYAEEVQEIIANTLGIQWDSSKTEYVARISACLQNGYMGTWNLRRQTLPAVQAGSCVPYFLTEDLMVEKHFVGERSMEGYGQFRIRKFSEMDYIVPEKAYAESLPICVFETINPLVTKILLKKAMQEAKLEAVKNRSMKVSNSALGRITLMLKESLGILNHEEAFSNFSERIESIKKDSVRNQAERAILSNFGTSEKINEGNRIIRKWTFKSIPVTESVIGILKAGESFGISYNVLKQLFDQKWGEYLMASLVSQKYESAKGGNKDED